jgi:uncharacterized protein YjbI with pentapeptide repeats
MKLFKQKTILFSIEAPEGSKVEIAGDFTKWKEAPLKLKYKGDNVYERKVPFKRSGTYKYKYLIDGKWDESMQELQPKSKTMPNGFGSENFVVDVRFSNGVAKNVAPKTVKGDVFKMNGEAHDLLVACSDAGNFYEWDSYRANHNYEKIYIQGADFSERDFRRANLSNIDFNFSNFRKASLSLVCFDDCQLRETDFRGACFSDGSARNANFTDADLRESTLEATKFLKSKMIGADLRGAHAKYTHLEGADLHHARIESADFSFAIVDGETLIDTIDVDRRTLFTSVGLSSARLRSGLLDTLNYNIRRNRWEEWFKTGSFLNKLYKNLFIHLFWKISDYGRSTRRILYIFLSLAVMFWLIYWLNPDIITNMHSDDVIIKAFHTISFSVVTMITLGFGSMNAAPTSLLGHITVAMQIIAGYVILAALVSRIAIMFDSEGPDVEHKPLFDPEEE